jgi:hypothetical protein
LMNLVIGDCLSTWIDLGSCGSTSNFC